MTKSKFIYCKTVDYMSRMALEKDDFGRFYSNLGISCYRKLGRGARCIKGENWAFNIKASPIHLYTYIYIFFFSFFFSESYYRRSLV